MKHISHFLFWAGVFISASGFLVGQADRIPFIHKCISAKYANALSGQRRLVSSGSLRVFERGFNEIAHAYDDRLSTNGSPSLTILSIRAHLDKIYPVTGPDAPAMGSGISLLLSDGKTISSDNLDLANRVASLKDSGVLFWSTIIFAFGLIVTILSRYLPRPQLVPCKNPEVIQNTHDQDKDLNEADGI